MAENQKGTFIVKINHTDNASWQGQVTWADKNITKNFRSTLELIKLMDGGYSFYVMKGKCQLTVHPKSKAKMKSRLKELTSRSNGWGYAKRKQKLTEYIRGWVGYYHLANMKRLLLETDEWLRRRIRMCIWKAWKKPKTKVANLIKCGINKYKAYEWGNTRKGYWRIADSPILKRAIDNNKLRSAGYATLMETYLEWYPKSQQYKPLCCPRYCAI